MSNARDVFLGRVRAALGKTGSDAATIADARKVWEQAGIRDYDLEWTASGMNRAHYFVTVRGSDARRLLAVLRAANEQSRWIARPGATQVYRLIARPLLPDQRTCASPGA